MARWVTYVKERFALAGFFLLCGGIVWSGQALVSQPTAYSLLVAIFSLVFLLVQIRMMDELKDYQKDLIAHPERPLARGLVRPSEVKRVIHAINAFLVIVAIILWLNEFKIAAYLYFALIAFLQGMYHEFWLGEWLNKKPFVYAISHQGATFMMSLFGIALLAPLSAFSKSAFAYAFLVTAIFLVYEVCRKLDPNAHPILKNYLTVYGPAKTGAAVVIFLGVAATSVWFLLASQSALLIVFWALQFLVLLVLPMIGYMPKQYKLVEIIATVSVLAQLWIIPLFQFFSQAH